MLPAGREFLRTLSSRFFSPVFSHLKGDHFSGEAAMQQADGIPTFRRPNINDQVKDRKLLN